MAGRGIKLFNHTRYDGRELRRLLRWCLRHEGVADRHYHFRVSYCRRGISGRGQLGACWVQLNLPGPKYLRLPWREWADGAYAAQVLIHEIGHTLGLEHHDMASCRRIDVRGLPEDLVRLRLREAKQPKARDVVVERYQRNLAHMSTWERKLRLAKTKVSKYRQAVRRYERQYPARIAAYRPKTKDD